ncbi:hypothetical protein HPB50_026005 [Hyalomma asiaticum]|uniref:Uncharacterized protein n=1 Tax=Hyalomma asiaticum TaxID=266040 RepID=A0ACB7SRI1_HYAAI|nr:hypothetical protein HPB50_026005 [Hyalomma asiaticum]
MRSCDSNVRPKPVVHCTGVRDGAPCTTSVDAGAANAVGAEGSATGALASSPSARAALIPCTFVLDHPTSDVPPTGVPGSSVADILASDAAETTHGATTHGATTDAAAAAAAPPGAAAPVPTALNTPARDALATDDPVIDAPAPDASASGAFVSGLPAEGARPANSSGPTDLALPSSDCTTSAPNAPAGGPHASNPRASGTQCSRSKVSRALTTSAPTTVYHALAEDTRYNLRKKRPDTYASSREDEEERPPSRAELVLHRSARSLSQFWPSPVEMKPDVNDAVNPKGVPPRSDPVATRVDGQQAVILSQPTTAVSAPLHKGDRSLMPAVALITTFAGFVCVATVAYALLRPKPLLTRTDCDSDDCFQHAYMLVSGLNRSADPCADFGEYVCSAWFTTSIYSFDMQQDRWHRWILESGQLLGSLRSRRGNEAIAKATALFHLCLKINAVTSKENAKLLQRFMRERRIIPAVGEAARQSSVHPLDVLLDLAINWQMPFWFNVHVLRANGSALGILMRPGHYEVFWERAVERFIMEPRSGDFEGTVDGPKAGLPNTTGDFFVDSAILSEMRNVTSSPPKSQPVAVRIKEISSVTPSVTSDQWLQFLNKHLAPTFTVTSESQILLDDKSLLVAVNRVLEKYEHNDILAHIGRLVNRTFGNVISRLLQSSAYDEIASLSPLTNVSYACEVQVEDTFRLPIAIQHIAKHQLSLHRAAIDELIGDVMRSTISLLGSSGWMNPESKHEAIKRIQRTSVRLWPPEQLMRDDGALDSLFATFTSSSKVYFQELLLVRNATRGLLGTPAYEDVLGIPHGGRDPYFAYDAFSNSINLAVGAVVPPLFYAGATKSINYGGAAALLAPLVLSLLNTSSVAANASGWVVTSGDPFLARHPCSASVDDRDAYPGVAAIEVAHRAYQDSLERDGLSQDVRVRSLEEFTGEQLFFMSFCHNTCRLERGTKTSKICNAALRGYKPFADAFRCASGSFMNPEKKCGFFY